jgi:lipopolysaccharide export system protein LptA
MEADNAARLVHFIGNVIAVQGKAVMNCDLLVVRYKSSETTGQNQTTDGQDLEPPDALGAVSGGSQGGGIETMTAVGRVVLVREDRNAECNQAFYDFDSKTIRLTGNPILRQGADSLDGYEILVHTDSQQVEVFGSKTKRVSASFVPSSGSGKPTPAEAESGTGQDSSSDPPETAK